MAVELEQNQQTWRVENESVGVVAATLSAQGATSSLTLAYGRSAMLPWQQF